MSPLARGEAPQLRPYAPRLRTSISSSVYTYSLVIGLPRCPRGGELMLLRFFSCGKLRKLTFIMKKELARGRAPNA